MLAASTQNTKLAILGLLWCSSWPQLTVAADSATVPSPQRQNELIFLLRNDCGACHGLHLTGGLGPSLRPETLQDKPAQALAQVILKGRPGTPMPGWERFMSENEARWLARTLLEGLPDEN